MRQNDAGLAAQLRVLIVDDNAANRYIMEQWLSDWQMKPTAVGDGMAAMDALWQASRSASRTG